ncbi:hypothetical protein OZ411_42150 [Bradyrhizobium sp. Arg237L]|uniref:hypothetical protein n=1 Tax=Bradyrhizobium sp. Arg237L TaxID=3003352 RepID=UPI00249DD954|nr:hypothetical protein [Bradyrhizobium sp. Arg237L]MDI4239396.1 hypothetical protein [Bradyrhizobium sp. Arg237L]
MIISSVFGRYADRRHRLRSTSSRDSGSTSLSSTGRAREEKAAFAAATFAKMEELLDTLHGDHVNEVRGEAFGYSGVTQNERRQLWRGERRNITLGRTRK